MDRLILPCFTVAACLVADVAYFTDIREVFCSCILKCHTRPSHSRAYRDNTATVSYVVV